MEASAVFAERLLDENGFISSPHTSLLYTVSPGILSERRSTRDGEGHRTKTHAYVTRAVCVDPVHTTNWTNFRVTVVLVIYITARVTYACVLVLWLSPFQVERPAIRFMGVRVNGVRCISKPYIYFGCKKV